MNLKGIHLYPKTLQYFFMENILSSLAGLCLLPQPPHVLLHRLLKPQPWPGVNVRLRAKKLTKNIQYLSYAFHFDIEKKPLLIYKNTSSLKKSVM